VAIPDGRLQELIDAKDTDAAQESCEEHGYSESWSIIDGALVIYNLDAPPHWLPREEERDENGLTQRYVEECGEDLTEEEVTHSRSFWAEKEGCSVTQA